MDEDASTSQPGDSRVITGRLGVTEAIAALTARHEELNQEMT